MTNRRDSTLTQSFGYDELGRLSSGKLGSTTSTLSFDAAGNRKSLANNGVTTQTYSYSSTNQRLSSLATTGAPTRAWTYDAHGNTNGFTGSDGVAVGFHYNVFGRIDSSSRNSQTTSYSVNALGQRVRKAGPNGTTRFIHGPDGSLLAEYKEGAGWTDYVRANGETLGLPGQYYEPETNTWNNGFRTYDASIGRYVQSDPIGLGGGVNTYSYVSGDPINRIDPLGLKDYSACETEALLAEAAAEAGNFRAFPIIPTIRAINNHRSGGDMDFAHNESTSTFIVRGTTYNASQFGNYIAGYAGANYAGMLGTGLVYAGGILINAADGANTSLRDGGGTGRKFDWDKSSRPYITAGEKAGLLDLVNGAPDNCGCK